MSNFGLSGALFAFAGLLYRIESKFFHNAFYNHISEASHTLLSNNNYNSINKIKLNNNNYLKNYYSNGTNYSINNNEYTNNTKIINEKNYETNNSIYDNIYIKKNLKNNHLKQCINNEDADSDHLTLINSLSPSKFAIIAQQQPNYNNNCLTSILQLQKQEEINEKYMLLNSDHASLKLNLNYNNIISARSETSQETNNNPSVKNKINTNLCLKSLNHDNTSDLIKKLINNNYFKVQPFVNDTRQSFENDNEFGLKKNEISDENDLNNNQLLLHRTSENEEMNHPLVSAV